jgi:hypothetical protein
MRFSVMANTLKMKNHPAVEITITAAPAAHEKRCRPALWPFSKTGYPRRIAANERERRGTFRR